MDAHAVEVCTRCQPRAQAHMHGGKAIRGGGRETRSDLADPGPYSSRRNATGHLCRGKLYVLGRCAKMVNRELEGKSWSFVVERTQRFRVRVPDLERAKVLA